jgi:hypothetical protein
MLSVEFEKMLLSLQRMKNEFDVDGLHFLAFHFCKSFYGITKAAGSDGGGYSVLKKCDGNNIHYRREIDGPRDYCFGYAAALPNAIVVCHETIVWPEDRWGEIIDSDDIIEGI